MAATTNGVNQRKGPDDGIHEDLGPNLSHVKTSGGMTISPELFEKVRVFSSRLKGQWNMEH
jgi:hypothetical protein